MDRENSNNYREIFLSDAPMIDLRAPSEFEQGAFPSSINLPLMDDEQRRLVGICYKSEGKEKAIELGHNLVQGELKKAHIAGWKQFAKSNPANGYFYCFRGGLRSKTSQQWLAESGIDYPLIEGGYKALRRYLIDQTEELCESVNISIITGLTGSAKTKLINRIDSSIDLEGLANHRGSSFGKNVTPQPSQISFENSLAIQLMKHKNAGHAQLYLEDESRLIGSRALPLVLKDQMDKSPLILIEESFEYRLEQIFEDYVVGMLAQFYQVDNDNSVELYANYLFESTNRIKKRLGGQGLKDMHQLISQAIDTQKKTGELDQHKNWISYLLKNYYDAMYQFQLEKKRSRVVFKGDTSQVLTYIHSNNAKMPRTT